MNKSTDPMSLLKQDHEMVKQLFSSIGQSNDEEQDEEEEIFIRSGRPSNSTP